MDAYNSGIGHLTTKTSQDDFVQRVFGTELRYDATILDAGCGVGCHLASLNVAHRIGLDISIRNLTSARKQFRNIDFILGDAEELPFRNDSFDAVLIVSLLHHVENHDKAIVELCRVLKPSSQILISDSSINGVKLIYPVASLIVQLSHKIGGYESFGPRLDLLKTSLFNAGFKISKLRVSGSFVTFVCQSLIGFLNRIGVGRRFQKVINNIEAIFRRIDRFVCSYLDLEVYGIWFDMACIRKVRAL